MQRKNGYYATHISQFLLQLLCAKMLWWKSTHMKCWKIFNASLSTGLSIFTCRIRSIVLLAFKIPNILVSCNCTYTTWPINLPLPLYPTSPQGNVWAPLFVLTQQWSSHLLLLCTPMPSAVPHRYQPHSFTTDYTHHGQGDMLDARKRYRDNSETFFASRI